MRIFGKSRLAIALFSVMAGYLFAGCSFVKSREAAEKVVNHHFEMIATNGYEAAMIDYSPKFFQTTPKDAWTKELAKLSDQLGPYQRHNIDGWRVWQTTGAYGLGATVNLQMQVTYARHNAVENFTIFKGAGDPDYRIVAHSIHPDGLPN